MSVRIISTSYIFESVYDDYKDIKFYNEFRKVNKVERILRKVWRFIFSDNLWYDEWKQDIEDNDLVIVHASKNSNRIINYIRKKNKQVRIIHWFWNTVNTIKNIDLHNTNCELWSFDPIDCQNYNMKFNTTHYFSSLRIKEKKIVYDVFFIGYDKGRKESLDKLQKDFISKGITSKLLVFSEKPRKNIPYTEVLGYIAESKAILDVVMKGQHGLSLRTMESIFFKKKLITNFEKIQDEDFYHPNNIFIIGKDTKLLEFLNSPYVQIDPEILSKYEILNWAKRFKT